MTLAAALSRLPAPETAWDSRISLGLPDAAMRLSDLGAGGAALVGLVAVKRAQAPGGDDRLGCAYLVGELGHIIGTLLGGLWLAGWHVTGADCAAIALTLRDVPWDDDGTLRIAPVIDLHLDPAALTPGPAVPLHLAQMIEALHRDIIAALTPMTGLAQAAQWRLVGDGLSGALLEQGKALGQAGPAMALGRAILANRATRLFSRQTEYVEIILPGETPDAPARGRDWFRLRGGCCRYYTSAGGDYCTTCVLRDRDDQTGRLQDYLATTLSPT